MKLLLREVFQFVFDAIKVPNKVMSGFVDECIMTIIKNTQYKPSLLVFSQEFNDNKSGKVRERIMVSLI